ncbi:hypothetical protein [Treponema sp. JC4]|uniref:hypothetical protein n=1 Tax=Treponema sp. JC4 TaxID=1124982 RepID=UPI000587D627|nr:hypothetical protein [Treponema sp. JC4]
MNISKIFKIAQSGEPFITVDYNYIKDFVFELYEPCFCFFVIKKKKTFYALIWKKGLKLVKGFPYEGDYLWFGKCLIAKTARNIFKPFGKLIVNEFTIARFNKILDEY